MKILFILLFASLVMACNNNASDTGSDDPAKAIQPDTMVNDNTLNRDTAPAMASPANDTTLKSDTLRK
jgi:hypothetical protein